METSNYKQSNPTSIDSENLQSCRETRTVMLVHQLSAKDPVSANTAVIMTWNGMSNYEKKT